MDTTDRFSYGKSNVLREEYKPFYAPNKICANKKRWRDLCSFMCAFISVVACTLACICALYCHRALTELRSVNTLSGSQTRISPTNGKESYRVHYVVNEQKKSENQRTSDLSYSSAGEKRTDDSEDNTNSTTEFKPESDSISMESNDALSTDDKIIHRVRRGTKQAIKLCKRNCTGKGPARRKCRRACNKQSLTSQQSETKLTVNLPAAHFEANMMDERTQKLVETQYTRMRLPDEGPLKIFKQANWVAGSSPVSFNEDSVATATVSGIFLVYAQAYIGGGEPEKSIIIVQTRGSGVVSTLSCDNGVNSRHSSDQMQTCSVFGLMKLEKGDTVEIQRSLVTMRISLDEDKTFFGLVQLSGITVNQ